MKVEIWYCKDVAKPYFSPLSEQEWELAHIFQAYTTLTRERVLNLIFREMNIVDGDETPCALGIRSMSVGDVVIFGDEDFWVCKPVGWQNVTDLVVPTADGSPKFKRLGVVK